MSAGNQNSFWSFDGGAFMSNKDDWETPQRLFDYLNAVYKFTLDPCSTHENAKCRKHYTAEENGLAFDWSGETVFCNPPYGKDIKEWVAKCANEARQGVKIVLLIPARTDTSYFHDYLYKKDGVRLEFIRGRLRFEWGGATIKARAIS